MGESKTCDEHEGFFSGGFLASCSAAFGRGGGSV